jgi:integrase
MAATGREKTKYPGVFFREVRRIGGPGTEKVFYIVFKKDGKVIEEKAGRQYADDMTAAKAARIRAERIEGKRQSNKEKRLSAASQASRVTIDAIWAVYQTHSTGKASLRGDISRYNLYLKGSFGHASPEDITTLEIDNLRIELTQQNKAPQTIKHILGQLRRIIRFGAQKGICELPPTSRLHFEMPRIDNQKTEMLTTEQLTLYIKALDEEEDQGAAAFLRLALATGMRRGALIALRWDDIDWQRNMIRLRGESAKKRTTDFIPLTATARQILAQIPKSGSEFVFPGKEGEQRQDFRRIARRVKKRAGLPEDFRPLHGLRHAYASFLASSGKVDLYTLQKLLTHSSPQMTQRYAHLADEALHRAANIVDDMLNTENMNATNTLFIKSK